MCLPVYLLGSLLGDDNSLMLSSPCDRQVTMPDQLPDSIGFCVADYTSCVCVSIWSNVPQLPWRLQYFSFAGLFVFLTVHSQGFMRCSSSGSTLGEKTTVLDKVWLQRFRQLCSKMKKLNIHLDSAVSAGKTQSYVFINQVSVFPDK